MGLSLNTRRARVSLVRDAIVANGAGALHVYGSVYPGQDLPSAAPPLFIRSLLAGDFVMHPTEASMLLEVEGNVALSGAPTWARFVDGSAPVVDCTAGPPGSGAKLIVTDNEVPPSSNMYPGGLVTSTILFEEAP